jgi:hypothetical protein
MGHVIFKDEFIRATLQNNSRDQFEQSHWSQCFSLNLGKAYEAYYKVQGLWSELLKTIKEPQF